MHHYTIFKGFRLLVLPLIILLMATAAFGQDVEFHASADAREVAIGGYVEVTFVIRNGNGKNLTAPDFDGFNILGGPNRSASTSIINGSMTQSSSFTYVLEPTRTGTLTIGAATVEVGGTKYQSAPITINVVAEKLNNRIEDQLKNAGEVFVRLELSHTTAYLGQQVVLDYVVYTRTNISSFNFNTLPDFTGIYVKDFENYDAGSKRRIINGQNYTTRVIKRQALYPQKKGTVEISPAVITLGIPFANDNPFGSLFSSSKPKQVKTNALQLEIIPFPTPTPPGFTGTAGQYSYSASVDKTQLSTDDALMIHFTIKGDGDMKKVQPPVMPLDTVFTVYPPELLEDVTHEVPGSIEGQRTYVVDVTLKYPGAFTLNLPSFTYFDTDQKTYKTIHADPIVIHVSQGNELPTTQQEQPVETEPEVTQTFFQKYKNGFYGGLGAIAILTLLALVRRRKTDKAGEVRVPMVPVAEDQPYLPTEPKEYFKPYNELLEIETMKQAGEWQNMFARLNEVSARFLSEKFNVPFSSYSIAHIIDAMAADGIPKEHYEDIRQLLQSLELAAYARQYNIDEVDIYIERVKKMIREI